MKWRIDPRRSMPWGLVVMGLLAACGGIAVVDGGGSGSGGATSTTTTSGSNPLCATPDPVGALEVCGGSAGSGAGDVACSSVHCDADGNSWESDCHGSTCRCKYNGVTKCTCFSDKPLCEGSPSCCPAPNFPE